jgi:hypothetical protein
MKKSIKLFAVLVTVMFATNTFASELGIKLSSLNLAPPTKSTSKKSSKGSSGDKAFEGKGSKTVLLGLGGSNMFTIFSKNSEVYDSDLGFGSYSPISGGISVDAEFGVHKYVGIGIHTGVFGSRSIYGGLGFGRGFGYSIADYSGYYSGLYIPIGIIANFHFFQLIEDKTSKDIHGDKIDLYVGANIGSGLAVAIPYKAVKDDGGKTVLGALVYGGIQVGVKYYFNPKIGVFAEVGYGKTFANGGIAFKL